jgi:hypothetical protein
MHDLPPSVSNPVVIILKSGQFRPINQRQINVGLQFATGGCK